jgi:uncharacterized protein DUF3800
MKAERFRLTDFSVMIRPPGDWSMTVLRAYFDNSGDEQDGSQKCLSLGGYLGRIDTWAYFDHKWSRALNSFGVGYLHMKEFGEPNGIYSGFSKDQTIDFLSSLVDVIAGVDLAAFGSTVRIGDLRRFNAEKHLNLDAYSLALHECCQWMGRDHQSQIIDTVVDRIPDAHEKISMAEQYSRSSVHAPGYVPVDFISIVPLPRKLSARNVRPLQAADFLVWELHRAVTNENEWWEDIKPLVPDGHWFFSHLAWHAKRSPTKSVEFPYYQRKSFNALRRASPVAGSVWDYKALCDVNEVRRGIWAASK